MSEEELTALQNQSVAVMGAAERGDGFTDEESEAAVAVVLAVPALCDEVRFNSDAAISAQRRMEALEAENAHLLNACELAMRYLTRLHERPGMRLDGDEAVGNALLNALQRARRS